MNFILDMLKGAMIGIANVIPGVSGGTMAVSMGIYNKLISSVSHLFSQFKKSIRTLLPILIGCVIGIVCFTYAIKYLLTNQPLPTCLTFLGLILGGVPVLIREMKTGIRKSRRRKLTAMNVLAFLVMFLLAAALPFLKESTDTLTTLTATPGTMIVLFFMGIIAAATMVIPGVSGSMILMILGYYYGVINSITGFMDALKAGNWNALLGEAAILIPFGIGCVLGIFLIAKLIEYLFERHTVSTYAAILGLILSSPFGIFHNTGALAHVTVGSLIIGIILMIAGAFGTWYMGETR
ncbi:MULTISPECIES: DUF368 domain-containing protein [unclassified Candidatus Paralachnospira]|uniref:DUF368 domain-containing protein n=1 Tax=unclassified Candidatus Paralachnospira TaxID=3099471 RepID=UPI003F92FE95